MQTYKVKVSIVSKKAERDAHDDNDFSHRESQKHMLTTISFSKL